MLNHAHLLSLIVNTPLMAHPRKAAIVYNVIRSRSGGAEIDLPRAEGYRIDILSPEKGASEFVGSQPAAGEGTFMRREPYRLDRGVGIITTTGSLVNRGAWIGNDGSGLTSYEGTKFQLARAAQDSRVNSVILDIETPGGQATGAMELAKAVRDLAAVKPVYAVVNGMAASAGYAMASGATRIITTPSGLVGSIGVVMLHLDESAALADAGVKPTFIFAGDKKVQGNGLEALSEQDRADLQAEVDQTYDLFLDTVAKGRKGALTKAKARDTQAGTFMGRAAVDIGLADDVGTFEDVLKEAQGRARRASGSGSAGKGKASMSLLGNDDQGQQATGSANAPAGATISQAQFEAQLADARKTAAADATKAANDRFAAILGNEAVAGRERAALALAIENPGMSADSVVKFVETHVPAPVAGVTGETRKTIAERAQQSGANTLNNASLTDNPARPGGETNADDKQASAGWTAAREKAAKDFEASNRRPGAR